MANTHSLDVERDLSQYAYITDANQTGLDTGAAITLEAWIKLESDPSPNVYTPGIIGHYASSTGYFWRIATNAGNTRFQFFASSEYHEYILATDPTKYFLTGVWYHIAVSWNGTDKKATFYVNGSSVGQSSVGSVTTLANSSADFRVGADYGTNYFDGLIDEARVWNDVRTPAEISANYQKELVGNESGLVGYWKFNNSALDETSNNNDLTLSGSPNYSTDVPFSDSSVLASSIFMSPRTKFF